MGRSILLLLQPSVWSFKSPYKEMVQRRRLADFLGGESRTEKSKLGRDIEIIIEKKASGRENTTREYESENECQETTKG